MTSDRQPGGVAKAYGRKYVEFDTLPGAVRVALYGRGALARHAGVSADGPYIDGPRLANRAIAVDATRIT
jgi:hypothetical protein